MIDIYITHFVVREIIEINDVLVDQLYKMRDVTPSDLARIRVVVWTNDQACLEDLRRRVPRGIEIFINDRPGRPDAQPSMRNKVIDLARASGCKAFVLLHNDVRPARGWFEHLIDDWREAEKRWGRDSSVISPHFIPYHLTDPHPASGISQSSALWKRLSTCANVLDTKAMTAWCRPLRSSQVRFIDDEVVCPKKSSIEDDGHILMMFIASPRFFDAVGGCDESMTGTHFDDSDWGIRALRAGKRNLQSDGALVGHIAGFTINVNMPVTADRPRADNTQLFIAKWGREMFDEMQTGQLWKKLHREQP